MIYLNRGFTLITLFFFLVGLFVNVSWARDVPLNTESTLNADNFRFDLSWSLPKQDHVLASRAVNIATRTDASEYAGYAAKGENLDCVSQMDNAAASVKLRRDPAAVYTTTAQLENAGWILVTDSDEDIASDRTRISGYLDDEEDDDDAENFYMMDGISVDLANNNVADWKWVVGEDGVLNIDEYTEAVKTIADMAEAQYKCWYNVAGGLIIVDYAWSPSFIISENEDNDWWPEDVTAPAVSKLSDVIYIEWASQASAAGTDVATLQYVIQLNVVNVGSRLAMNMAMQARNNDWSSPEVFTQGSTEFNALLGSPNGNPQAWLLINHKADLGVKTVYSITVWTSSTIVSGQNEIQDDDDAKTRSMCWVEDAGYYGLCQHMLFTFEDVSTSTEDAMDLS